MRYGFAKIKLRQLIQTMARRNVKSQHGSKRQALTLLREQLAEVAKLKKLGHACVELGKWREKTHIILANLFDAGSSQLENFDGIHYSAMAAWSGMPESVWQDAYIAGLNHAEAQLEALIAEVEEFWEDEMEPVPARSEPIEAVELLCDHFHAVSRQLRTRHQDRPTLAVNDEYDVQDLLHCLLRIFFDDVRDEEVTPSYAGGFSRMDFILHPHGVVIEVKKSSARLRAKEVGDQLLIDIMRYKVHPAIKTLVCFVYDPEGLLKNPAGLENDLSKRSDGLDVRCIIRPK